MRRLVGFAAVVALLTAPLTARAQSAAPQAPPPADAVRPATTTASGATGLWFVPSAEVLPHKRWAVSFYRTNFDDGQGFSDVSTFPATFAFGVGNRGEIFGNWSLVTRIDRDTRPLFFAGNNQEGTGGGILPDYPLVRKQWIGNQLGDIWIGGKLNLLANTRSPLAAAVRAQVKLPVGADDEGASSGKSDFAVDGILSTRDAVAEFSGYGGVIVRGNPTGYSLTNGFRWGVGVALPQRYNLGLRVTAEVFGEQYFDKTITAPAGLFGADGSAVPVSTTLKNPVNASVGLTWQAPNGFFVGAAASWNLNMSGRDAAGLSSTPKDDKGLQVRIGFHPGARDRDPSRGPGSPEGARPGAPGAGQPGAPSAGQPGAPGAGQPGAPGAGQPGAPGVGQPARPGQPAAGQPGAPGAPGAGQPGQPGAPGAGGGAGNRPPTVRASCDPCTVEVGRTSTIRADAQDPDGDALRYSWAPAAGTIASPTDRQSTWTAPMQPGPVRLTVTVDDGRGGTAADAITIQVVQAARRSYTFEDVHFDFDRSMLRADALRVLDEAIAALQSDASLQLLIEGHTCNIGTTEYNLALGERRAQAVRDYLISRGINGSRLRTASYGEERAIHNNGAEDTRRLNRRAALVVQMK